MDIWTLHGSASPLQRHSCPRSTVRSSSIRMVNQGQSTSGHGLTLLHHWSWTRVDIAGPWTWTLVTHPHHRETLLPLEWIVGPGLPTIRVTLLLFRVDLHPSGYYHPPPPPNQSLLICTITSGECLHLRKQRGITFHIMIKQRGIFSISSLFTLQIFLQQQKQ